MMHIIDLILHVDLHLKEWLALYGIWIYVILFVIIFAETGLVVTPFLPGDSLLFAAGALTALGDDGMNIWLLGGLLMAAAIIGDQLNYTIGNRFGQWLLTGHLRRWVKVDHIRQTEMFMAKYGASAIVLARFAPIVRTFAPFVAGIGNMNRRRFLMFNVIGAILWVQIFLWLGHLFGNLPVVQKNFSLVIAGIIAVSLIPLAVGWWKARNEATAEAKAPQPVDAAGPR
ncbi:MAG: DedA family protein [Bdellovibrionaceae bacterium]|nr:DedA family protein [Pseudobdellovibrionaceae bacterium]